MRVASNACKSTAVDAQSGYLGRDGVRDCASGSAAIGDGDFGLADGVLDATITTNCIRWWIVGVCCEVSGLV